jgi:ABC-type multidrug transport system ATPase subunit
MASLSSGHANVLGIDIATDDRRQLRRRAGWLGHEGSFYDDLTVTENLTFAARALGRPLEDIAPSLDLVGLAHRSGALTKSLSAGQRRRLSLAWMVVRRPELWLLDEPYASLDASGRVLLSSLIGDAIEAGATVIVTSHDPLVVDTPSRVVELRGGRVSSDVS